MLPELRSTGVPVPILQRAKFRAIVRISPVMLQVQTATGASPEWCDAIHSRTPLWRRRAGQPVATKPRFGGAFHFGDSTLRQFERVQYIN
jgi:hypothetical protein